MVTLVDGEKGDRWMSSEPFQRQPLHLCAKTFSLRDCRGADEGSVSNRKPSTRRRSEFSKIISSIAVKIPPIIFRARFVSGEGGQLTKQYSVYQR